MARLAGRESLQESNFLDDCANIQDDNESDLDGFDEEGVETDSDAIPADNITAEAAISPEDVPQIQERACESLENEGDRSLVVVTTASKAVDVGSSKWPLTTADLSAVVITAIITVTGVGCKTVSLFILFSIDKLMIPLH